MGTRTISLYENLIFLLTVALYACFSIFATDDYWSSNSLLIITAIITLLTFSRKGLNGIPFNSFHKTIIPFIIFCFASTIWATSPDDSIEKGITVVKIVICMTIVMWAYRDIDNAYDMLLKAVMWGGFMLTLYACIIYGIDKILLTAASGYRLPSTFDNVNSIGLRCALSIIISFYFFFYQKKRLILIFDMPTLLLLAACGSRKALVLVVVGLFAVSVSRFTGRDKSLRYIKILCSIIAIVLVFYFVSRLNVFSGINERMLGLFAMLEGSDEADSSALLRKGMNELGFSLFLENPILGIGIGSAHIYTLKVFGHDSYLHNNYAELLASGGIIGTILFYYIHFDVLKKIRKNKKFSDNETKMAYILLFSLFLSDTSEVSYYTKIFYFFIMIFYVYIYSETSRKRLR